MKILGRYIAEAFLINLVMAQLGLASLVVVSRAIGMISEGKYPVDQAVTFYTLDFLNYFVMLTPPAVLLAVLLTLSSLNRTHELVAYYSIGVGLKQITLLLGLIVVLVCCLILVMQDKVLPKINLKRFEYYQRVMKGRKDFHFDTNRGKVWYRSQNLIYNLEEFDSQSETIYGMWIYRFDKEFNLIQVTRAAKATYEDQSWILDTGTETSFDEQDGFPISRKFESKRVQLVEKPADFMELGLRISGLQIKQLSRYIEKLKRAGANTRGFEIRWHERISLSFIPLVMGLFAIPFSTRRTREGGMARDLGICFLVTVVYWMCHSFGIKLASVGSVPPAVGAWMTSGVFSVGVGLLFFFQKR